MAMRRNRHYYSSGHFLQVKSWLSSKIAPRWYSCSDSIGVHHFYPAAAMFWKVFLVLLALGIRVAVHGTSSGRSQHLSPVVPSVREGKLGTIRRLSQSLLGRIANIRAGAGSRVKEPNSVAEFDKILQRALKSQLVVVDFTASWCGPCKMIAPIYKEFAEQYSKAVFVKVDVDGLAGVAQRYEVRSMPTFVFFKNGKEVTRFSGASVEKLRATIQQHL